MVYQRVVVKREEKEEKRRKEKRRKEKAKRFEEKRRDLRVDSGVLQNSNLGTITLRSCRFRRRRKSMQV